MLKLKYYTTDDIKKLNPLKKVLALKHNKAFFKLCDKKYNDLLIINGYPLDQYQKQVVFSEDKYSMVIAGAGSGKSTTMIGKIKYLTMIKKINPNDIIAISFTNESVNSLKNSLEKNGVINVNVTTFHKLALSFLNSPHICPVDSLEYIVKEYLYMNKYNPSKEMVILTAFKEIDYNIILNKIDYYAKIIIKIINICHTYNYEEKDFLKALNIINKKLFNKKSLLCMLYIIMDIYYIYQEEKESTGSVDFDDMIIKATNMIKNKNLSYKYIIVDEYQDTSLIRVNFLKAIITNCNCNLTVVGDDYQSIYRFNGCDLNIFLNFKKYFPNPKIFKLQNTYRNSQELIDISKKFILKNPYQIKKKLISPKHLDNPIQVIYYNNYNKERKLLGLIKHINNIYGEVLILGRNNFDITNITTQKVNYLTVHASKGLEADNIIIINLENNIFGFPNQIEELLIEKVLFNNRSSYPYDEERRLFYVALTRTKNYVFLFVNKTNQSLFAKEIIKKN